MTACLFCDILSKKVPANIIYSDDLAIAFDDINPQAPQHKIIIPRKHIPTLNDATAEDSALLGHLLLTAATLAKQLNIADTGYRVVNNCNAGAGQTVFHLHVHLLGGRQFIWPPG